MNFQAPQWTDDLARLRTCGTYGSSIEATKGNISVLAGKGTLVIQPISYLLNTE